MQQEKSENQRRFFPCFSAHCAAAVGLQTNSPTHSRYIFLILTRMFYCGFFTRSGCFFFSILGLLFSSVVIFDNLFYRTEQLTSSAEFSHFLSVVFLCSFPLVPSHSTSSLKFCKKKSQRGALRQLFYVENKKSCTTNECCDDMQKA